MEQIQEAFHVYNCGKDATLKIGVDKILATINWSSSLTTALSPSSAFSFPGRRKEV